MLQEILLLMERRLADLGVTVTCRSAEPVTGGWLPCDYGRYFST